MTEVARRALPIDAARVRRSVVLALLLAAACQRTPESTGALGSAAPPSATFSREAFAPRAGDAGPSEPAVPTSADPAALDEILAAAPRASARAPTGADGGTAIGIDNGGREDADAADAGAAGDRARAPKVRVGKPTLEPDLSGAAVEQAARAQLYWPITQRCRGEGGRILPPEAVHVIFHIDADGYLIPPTILAQPKEERFAAAARCIARELSTTTFRAPPAARGKPHVIDTDVPSVD
ncbi:Hypothetical protein A7982_02000 [Minicystis rosea]|nr:Hypothetical protein A7982_02000 [Minicystis rosea]